ncbi:hypothetical protein AOQ84DRAFT_221672 [Glonium stellatum]|uniref:Uncharacterized protein n=1 Tax=Glonium stellatum TaxID=574774 RepID=A0A8E2JT86_9PEZI|nr:hypothetical protein AOQ84DRAFT_221672 [Glonium stellatum]
MAPVQPVLTKRAERSKGGNPHLARPPPRHLQVLRVTSEPKRLSYPIISRLTLRCYCAGRWLICSRNAYTLAVIKYVMLAFSTKYSAPLVKKLIIPLTTIRETPTGSCNLIIFEAPSTDPDRRVEASSPLIAILIRLVIVLELPLRNTQAQTALYVRQQGLLAPVVARPAETFELVAADA